MNPKFLSFLLVVVSSGVPSFQAGNTWVESLNPASAITNNRGRYAEDKGDYDKAIEYYTTSIRLAPNEWATYYNRARIYLLQRKWSLALQDTNTIIRLKPSFLMASIMRAQINETLGNYSAALQDYDAILKLKPLELTRAEVLADRAWIYSTCPNASLRNGSRVKNILSRRL